LSRSTACPTTSHIRAGANRAPWTLCGITGILIAVSLAACGSSSQEIQNLTTGTGYSAASHSVRNPSASFSVGQTAYVVFTADTSAHHAVAEVRILSGRDTTEDTSLPISLASGTHTYEQTISLAAAGPVTVEISYNGQVQASSQLQVG
jgi:hypothetical protein